MSLFNIGGRFFWASLSDYIGRKNTYYTFFLLGIAMYALAPWAAQTGNKALFVAFFCIILIGGLATEHRMPPCPQQFHGILHSVATAIGAATTEAPQWPKGRRGRIPQGRSRPER